jgi:arylsulfatase A-like enzyme
LGSFGWLPEIPRKYDKLANILFFSLLLLANYRLYDFLITPSEVEEPFSLTLFSGKRRSTVGSFSQGRSIDRKLAALEARVMADYQPNPNAARTNLVIIVVDALRYDHMGVSGYERETTPYLSGLAKRGKVSIADQARSVCGESVCGLASLASGRYSHQIPAEPFTLHRVLKRHGYQIRMILGDNHRNTYDPVALYGVIDDYFDGSMAKGKYFSDDGNVLSRTRELPPWNKQPFMLQYHLMSAHTMGKRLPIYQRFLPAEKYAGKVSGEKNERNTNHYDNGVLQADAIIEQLLASLKGGNYLQDTLVVVTADHGESLGEHDFFSHTNSVREELLHIPLAFIRYKNGIEQDTVRNEKFVSQIDIAPTILHEFHMPIPSTWTGLPVQLEEERKFIFFQMVPNLGLYDIRDRDRIWKYWVNAKTLEEFAFDLRLDAGENTNLIASVPDWLRASWRTQIGAIKLNDTP